MEENILNMKDSFLDTYTAEELMKILKVGKTATYDLIKDSYKNNKNFKVIKVGKQYRMPKKSFNDWFMN